LVPYTHKTHENFNKEPNPNVEPISAVFILENPTSWQATLQVLIDLFCSNGVIGTPRNGAPQIPLYNANPDFLYGGAYKDPRFTSGAFIECLSHLYKLYSGETLQVEQYGKPLPVTYAFANSLLEQHGVTKV
jgi:ribonucleotide monophosphatase NagD (HAD superfamily)